MFNLVDTGAVNPLVIKHTEPSTASVWTVDCAPKLPFGGWAQTVEGVVANGKIANGANVAHHGMPYVKTKEGANRDQITLNWGEAVEGTVTVKVRMDDPL